MVFFLAPFLSLIVSVSVSAACVVESSRTNGAAFPALGQEEYDWIAERIYRNEALGQERYLTHWGNGEDFPSFGIGHFIWFPDGVDAPFDETFPAMVAYQRKHAGTSIPPWLLQLSPFRAPWQSKAEFDAAQASESMVELRRWLASTGSLQTRFIVESFTARWDALSLDADRKRSLDALLSRLFCTPEGLFAVIDYYNFKGLGTNPRERYDGEGWGLIQVLGDIARSEHESLCGDELVDSFSLAAAARLKQRVRLSPPSRNEARWLEGWLHRVSEYRPNVAIPIRSD